MLVQGDFAVSAFSFLDHLLSLTSSPHIPGSTIFSATETCFCPYCSPFILQPRRVRVVHFFPGVNAFAQALLRNQDSLTVAAAAAVGQPTPRVQSLVSHRSCFLCWALCVCVFVGFSFSRCNSSAGDGSGCTFAPRPGHLRHPTLCQSNRLFRWVFCNLVFYVLLFKRGLI